MRPSSPRSRRCWCKARSNGVEGLELIGGNAARALEAELVLHRRLAVTGIRHRRQPRLICARCGASSTIAAASSRSRRRSSGCIAARHRSGRCNSAAAIAGTVAFDAVVNSAGLGAQKLARRIEGYPGRQGAAARARQGQLLRLRRAPGILAARSIRRRSTAGSACTSRSTSPAACASARTWNGSTRKVTRSIRAAPMPSMSASAPIGPACRTARCCPTIAACGRS